MRVEHAVTDEDLDVVRGLLREYVEFIAALWPEVDRSAFTEELDTLRETYPVMLLAFGEEGVACGCVMLRELEPGVCEVRRLFVQPDCRRRGIARALMTRLADEACALGYARMRLVTVTLFDGAIPLYESLGFVRVEPFREATVAVVVFMERLLGCAG